MKVVQISIEVNNNSVGRIAEQIGEQILSHGGESYITYARTHKPSKSQVIKIGNKFDLYYHGLQTRLFDTHCQHSKKATKKLVKQIEKINPDIIHLHHIHGYFINMEILFAFLKEKKYPVVWTFHDCWSFTGHCAYFDTIECTKWKTICHDCELKTAYPGSYFLDRSSQNYELKKKLFTSVDNLTIVPVSSWLENLVGQSFLKNENTCVIKNGIDVNIFKPIEKNSILDQLKVGNRRIILGIASTWSETKGLTEFVELDKLIDHNKYCIVLVGLSKEQIDRVPKSILGLTKTENLDELVSYYNSAFVFVNPTKGDTYPTTNLEAIACGIPVITYNTGGSVEAVSDVTGFVTKEKSPQSILESILRLEDSKTVSKEKIRKFAVENFNKNVQFKKYIELYNQVLAK